MQHSDFPESTASIDLRYAYWSLAVMTRAFHRLTVFTILTFWMLGFCYASTQVSPDENDFRRSIIIVDADLDAQVLLRTNEFVEHLKKPNVLAATKGQVAELARAYATYWRKVLPKQFAATSWRRINSREFEYIVENVNAEAEWVTFVSATVQILGKENGERFLRTNDSQFEFWLHIPRSNRTVLRVLREETGYKVTEVFNTSRGLAGTLVTIVPFGLVRTSRFGGLTFPTVMGLTPVEPVSSITNHSNQ